MSFRIENKYKIQANKLSNLYEWIHKNNGIRLFPKRNILSIYFDNSNLSLYNDSIEGVVPRKKIRLRTYNNSNTSNQNYNLEIKINSVEGRFKTSEKIKEHVKLLKRGYYDNRYGLCYPIVEIKYLREYFKIFGIRITLDTRIKFKSFNKMKNYNNYEKIILETKTQNTTISNYIDEKFFFEKIKFSKYCDAIDNVKRS
tara:strand:- start:285 stop:881 length:597 start_codon:yes stop_codon:yes gene_type:complete